MNKPIMLAETRKQKDMYAMFRKKIVSAIVFLLMIGSCTLITSADQTNDSDKYTFTNYGGEVYTPEPMEFGANLNDGFTLENGTERKHMLLQFYEIPGEVQFELLESYGLHYLSYAGSEAYVFSMPAEMTAADLPAESGLRWMGEIPVENKYDHIYGLDVPEWAKVGDGNIQLSVGFYDDVTYQSALDILDQYSNNITNFSYSLETAYEIITNENNITLIASEDAVMSLGYRNDDTVDETDFVDYEVTIEEDEPEPTNEQEDEIQETAEDTDEPEEKQSPGFTTTIGILTLTLIAIFKGNTRQKRK